MVIAKLGCGASFCTPISPSTPNLKPGICAISLRLPASMLDELRQMANQRDVPYQSLIEVFLRERIDTENQRNFAVRDEKQLYNINAKRKKYAGRNCK
jgi:hypothetical protein